MQVSSYFVIASVAKQSILSSRLDCFVAALLAMTNTSIRAICRLAVRRQSGEDKVDHLVERGSRLFGALRDHLRMKEPHHRGAGAHRRQRHVGGLELA